MQCLHRTYEEVFLRFVVNFSSWCSTRLSREFYSYYFETKSYAEVQRLFRLEFPNRYTPNGKNIWRNVQKYVHHGTSWNRNAKNSGRKRTARTNENIDAVHDELIRNPDGVSCRIDNWWLTSATFNRIVRIDIKWHPYKIHIILVVKSIEIAAF